MKNLVHYLVVHGPAELGMRVHDQGDGGVVVLGAMIARFDAAFGAIDDYIGHTLLAGAQDCAVFYKPSDIEFRLYI